MASPENYFGNITVKNYGESVPLEIRIHGVIGAGVNGSGMTSQEVSEQLASYDGEEITVSINSPGGSAADGIAIYNMLKRHPASVKVHIDGVAASAASVIAMAGDTIEMSDTALLMIHDPMVNCSGNSRDMRSTANTLDKWASSIANSYTGHFNIGVDEIRQMMAEETWLSAEQSMELGIVSQLSTSGEPIAALGYISNYSNAPKVLNLEECSNMSNQEITTGEIVEELKNEDAAEPTEVVEEVVEEVAEEAAEEVVEVAEECCDEPCDDCEVKNVTPADEAREELKKYMNAFGNDVGAEWFLNGVTWEDCQNRQLEQLKNEAESLRSELAELKEQNADLTGRVEAAVKASGEVSPVSNSGDEPETATNSGMASRIQMPN